MEKILVGLSNGKTSFWDPNTRTYLALDKKTKEIAFDEAREDLGQHLERICHGLFASNPSLKLYQGKIPEKALNHWKAKFQLSGLAIAQNRADRLNAASAAAPAVPPLEPVALKVQEEELKAAKVANEEVASEETEKTTKTRATRNKTTEK